MTIHIPLETDNLDAGPSTPRPRYVHESRSHQDDLTTILQCLKDSKRIVVVSGAGVSTAANIPDFRSSSGLFSDRRADKGKGKAREVDPKDLFHVKALSSPSSLDAHHALINTLASLSDCASPTPFHQYIASLSRDGRLLRCYTQNIDALESKAGLRLGIPSSPSPKLKSKSKSTSRNISLKTQYADFESPSLEHLLDPSLLDTTPKSPPRHEAEVQAVPLHGLLTHLRCTLCHTKVPMSDYLPLPPHPVPCPSCKFHAELRDALYERRRSSGMLRADVVLYGEEHPQGEVIGQQVEKDLKVVDCLLVVGTTLSVPGVKRIVKEMSKKLHHTTSASRGKGIGKGKRKGKVILINSEYPKGHWEGVFDYWISGDIQEITTRYLANPDYLEQQEPVRTTTPRQSKEKDPSTPRKNKKTNGTVFPPTPESLDRSDRQKSRVSDKSGSAWEEHRFATPTTPTKSTKRGHKEVEVVIPSPVSTKKRKCTKKEVIVEINRERESTPTPTPTPTPVSEPVPTSISP
ncbi:uncharacterized protein I303_105766 [Kwoniella dejecticola CBS 10117]|uniref:Deacetylase sirtuin-type domain-containing protein n=1 Tax=Kwoniella dejecticola CBS 10117 TaxID=1296121 RepID=A0A1A6A0D7_9TREE|nr:uncharacterized protein I303_05788 [Kwoniella dejecticola CBS 10117]OBR83508.1 hypothetical protein I303_05788 [Kwoniella dejecticola CBS 10117]